VTPAILVLSLLGASPSVKGDAAAPLRVRVVVSETAQLFHAVDQLSGWSPYTHKQYRAWFSDPAQGGLGAEDEALLTRYAQLRKRLGYGAIDAALYTDAPLDDALATAVLLGKLQRTDADVVRQTIWHFAARVRVMVAARGADTQAYAARIPEILAAEAAFLRSAASFFSVKRIEVPIFVVASPSNGFGGGGYNGERLVVEVGEGATGPGPLVHELWHAFAQPRRDVLLKAVKQTPGLDFETLSEGFAYAVSPGIWAMDPDEGDWLQAQVRADLQARKSFLNEPYVRFKRLAFALRPSLEPGLRASTLKLESALPLALATFRGLHALAEAQERTPRGFFVFGVWAADLQKALVQAGSDVWWRDLEPRQLESLRSRIRPQDVVVVVLPQADAGFLPEAFTSLFGQEWARVRSAVGASSRGRMRVSGPNSAVVLYWGTGEAGPAVEEHAWLTAAAD
jgi:hypothetical protein